MVAAVALIALGAIQNLSSGTDLTTLVGGHQTLTGGPVASQEAIKELGTNGGGFYNANSAHPFENPNALSNLLENFLLLLIPFALTRTFGMMVGDKRQGYAILATMGVIWGLLVTSVTLLEVNHPGTALQAAGRRHGGQGDPVRRVGLRALRRVHDRHVDRRGQLVPRLVHQPRRWRR